MTNGDLQTLLAAKDSGYTVSIEDSTTGTRLSLIEEAFTMELDANGDAYMLLKGKLDPTLGEYYSK